MSSNCPFKKQALHNESFHNHTCNHIPDGFYDWKITILFYTSIHYVKALANQFKLSIGNSHGDIRNNIKPPDQTNRKPVMAFSKGAYGLYDYLYRASQASRYNGFIDNDGKFTDAVTYQAIMKAEHKMCDEALKKLKKYIIENRHLSMS